MYMMRTLGGQTKKAEDYNSARDGLNQIKMTSVFSILNSAGPVLASRYSRLQPCLPNIVVTTHSNTPEVALACSSLYKMA